MKNTEIFQSGEKYRDFSKWSYCNERPVQMKIMEEVRNVRISYKGFIVIGNWPKIEYCEGYEKCKNFF